MGFLQFKKSGFEKYFGRRHDNDKDYDGSWGICMTGIFKYFSEYQITKTNPF